MTGLLLALLLATSPCAENLGPISYGPPYIAPPSSPLMPVSFNPGVTGGAIGKFNVVFVGDGFTAAELPFFDAMVDSVITAVTSFNPYRGCAFNFYRVRVISPVSGVDYPKRTPPVCKNTPLNTEFGDVDKGFDERYVYTNTPSRIREAAEHLTDNYDFVVALVNDTARGGIAWPTQKIATVSVGRAWDDIAIHELAHMVNGIGDEYGGAPLYSGGEEPSEHNLTIDITNLKWSEFVSALTPIPTKEVLLPFGTDPAGVVGAWVGGDYYDDGVWRPQQTCRMRESYKPFCKVCDKWIGFAMAIRCPLIQEVPADKLHLFPLVQDEGSRSRLPPCIPCIMPPPAFPDEPDTEDWPEGVQDTVLIELAGATPGSSASIVDNSGVHVTTVKSPEGGTLTVTFVAERLALYYLDFKPGPSDGTGLIELPVQLRLFVNGTAIDL